MNGPYQMGIAQSIAVYGFTVQQLVENEPLLLPRDMQHATQIGGGLQPEVYVTPNVKCVHLRVSLPPLYLG